MSLKGELDKIRADSLSDARIEAAYRAVVGQLSRAGTADQTLKVGGSMPPFMLPNAAGRLVVSDELLAKGPLVVTFFRGSWCPYCQRTLEALEEVLPRIHAAGAELVALTPDTGVYLSESETAGHPSPEILSDVDGAVGLQFGVLFRAPDIYRDLLAGFGVDLRERHGNEGWFIPIPASFVVDRTGTVRYAFVNADFTLRADPEEIVQVLEGLKSEGPR
ncbi:MAG TPA: peroxiredoxin-like family protein [Candidatus Udaeobacter sp.]|nr:peroxiredoxin-like family protein [Candidatus Udaeobacter sp.]